MADKKPPLIAVTRALPQAVEDRLARTYRPRFNPEDTVFTADQLVAHADGADALLACPTDQLTRAVIGRLPASLRIIATFSVGYDHIDLAAARDRNIAVTNTPDVLTDATADIAMLLILGVARGAYWGERMIREQTWRIWSPTGPLGLDVTGRRLGIFGMGRIGRAVARRARAFDMEIHYHGRKRLAPAAEAGALFHADFEEFLGQCEFLSINAASTEETRNRIDAAAIAALPDGAILVNTARGDIIDDDALIGALQTGKLAAAGLDVFRGEPDIDPRFRELQNVFLLPHLGSATVATRDAMGFRALDNLDQFFAGATPADLLTG